MEFSFAAGLILADSANSLVQIVVAIFIFLIIIIGNTVGKNAQKRANRSMHKKRKPVVDRSFFYTEEEKKAAKLFAHKVIEDFEEQGIKNLEKLEREFSQSFQPQPTPIPAKEVQPIPDYNYQQPAYQRKKSDAHRRILEDKYSTKRDELFETAAIAEELKQDVVHAPKHRHKAPKIPKKVFAKEISVGAKKKKTTKIKVQLPKGSPAELAQAVILGELFGPPLALRQPYEPAPDELSFKDTRLI